MKLIVGLGNPGPQYERTRHNAGFLALDVLARRHPPSAGGVPKSRFESACVETSVGPERCLLMKPNTFMNRSGSAIAQAVGFYKLSPVDDLLVLVDDVALPSGAIRLRQEGGAGGHNGLADIERALGTDGYSRCRIGIDAPPPPMILHDYVLGRFTSEQETAIKPALERAADAAEAFISSGIAATMNRFNAKPKPPPPPAPPSAQQQPGAA